MRTGSALSSRKALVALVLGLALAVVASACGNKGETPPAQSPAPAVSASASARASDADAGSPDASVADAEPPPAVPGQMAVPGPLAFPCVNDTTCGTHRCNTKYGKCAYPCQSELDCMPGTRCLVGPGVVTPGVCGAKP